MSKGICRNLEMYRGSIRVSRARFHFRGLLWQSEEEYTMILPSFNGKQLGRGIRNDTSIVQWKATVAGRGTPAMAHQKKQSKSYRE